MNAPIRIAALLLAAPLLQAATPAEFVYLETDEGATVHWEADEVRFHFDGVADPLVDRDAAETALVQALGTWAPVLRPQLEIRYAGRVDDGAIGYRSDGPNRNLVTFRADGWAAGDESLAVTLSTYVQSTGELLDTDIFVNTSANHWSVNGTASTFDLQSALLHEIGHALGLGHLDHDGSVMAPSLDAGHARHELTATDRAAVVALYDVGGTDTPALPTIDPDVIAQAEDDVDIDYPAERSLMPTCASAGALPGSAWWLLPVLLIGLRRRPRFAGQTAARAAALSAALVACVALPARASTVVGMDVDALTAASGIVIRATVTETTASWEGGVIVTRARVDVESCLQGPCPDAVDVTVLGGRVGEIVQVVAGAPELHPGVELVAFLRPVELDWQPVGLGQGVYYIDDARAEAIPATHGLRIVDIELGLTRHADTTPVPLTDLMGAIERAIASREDLP